MITPSPSRRSVLGGASLGAAALLLTGCKIRWEADADSTERKRRREVAKAEVGSLQTTTDQVRELAVQLRTLPKNPLAQRLALHHQEQTQVLQRWLTAAGVSASSSTSAATTSATKPIAPTPTSLALAELEGVDALGFAALPAQTPSLRATLLSCSGHRVAAATLLTAGDLSGGHAALPSDLAVALLGSVRPAQYAVQVSRGRITEVKAAARLAAADRVLTAWELALTGWAGAQAPAPQLSYTLDPRPVDTTTATTLVTRVLRDVISSTGSRLEIEAEAAALATLVTLLGEVAAAADGLGIPLVAFPGLSRPTP